MTENYGHVRSAVLANVMLILANLSINVTGLAFLFILFVPAVLLLFLGYYLWDCLVNLV